MQKSIDMIRIYIVHCLHRSGYIVKCLMVEGKIYQKRTNSTDYETVIVDFFLYLLRHFKQ